MSRHILTSHSRPQDFGRLTFRNDISRSMPSVSNLRGEGERERREQREKKGGRRSVEVG